MQIVDDRVIADSSADTVGVDVLRPDAGRDAIDLDAFDAGIVPDAQLPDAVIPDAGPCRASREPTVIVSETRQLSRPAFVFTDPDGIDMTVMGHVADQPDAILFLSAGPDGTLLNLGAATPTFVGAHVTGGGFAAAIEIYAVAYTSDETGAAQVYMNAVQSNAQGIPTSRQRITTSTVAVDSPDVTLRVGGYLVAWRSHESGATRVQVQPVGNIYTRDGAANFVSEAGFDVDSFRIVSSLDDAMYAVAYVGSNGGTREVRLALMDATATPVRSVLLASGADIGTTVDAVAVGPDVAAVWTQGATPSVAVGVIRSADAGAPAVLTTLPGPAASPGIARDGADFAVGYRSGTGDTARLVLARIRGDLSVHDVSIIGATAPGGRVGVGVAGGGHYGVGSADDFATGTIARLSVVTCPP